MKKQIWKLLCHLLLTFAVASSCMASAEGLSIIQKETRTQSVAAFAMKESTAFFQPQAFEPTATALSKEELEGIMLTPGGMPFGVRFYTEGVTVVGFCDVETKNGAKNPATEAGLRAKDVILSVNGARLSGAAELTERIEKSEGKSLSLHIRRGKEELEVLLTPIWCDAEARYKTGIWVRDSGAGIGTVTFIVPETGAFAGLGHGICDGESGELIPMKRGSVSGVTISSVVRGEAGAPGELKGFFNPGKTGALLGNSSCGVWGVFSEVPKTDQEPLPIALRDELCEGEADILTTLDTGSIGRYKVQITNVKRDATGSKCFTVTVTDPDLLARSGGIVQGMSGSPIIQNGKLVGAVTHVLINDPTTGYGIFIENMLNAANMPMAKAS